MATAVAPAPPTKTSADVELMEFVVDRNQLLTEVAAAARVSDTKSTQPLLTHLLVRARGGGVLSITGTDLQRTVTTECPAAIKTLGEATVRAATPLEERGWDYEDAESRSRSASSN